MTGRVTVRKTFAEACIRRANVRTTHQALAFDALGRLATPVAKSWRRLFLRHASVFAHGAAAPDTEFRDYKNHVLFQRDGEGAGAVQRAEAWYVNLLQSLKRQEWRNAAFCAGVLSHYLSDPLHPFHTGQSEAENDIHFALDAAVWFDYPHLVENVTTPSAPVTVDQDPSFISRALLAGAADAHRHFDDLIAHFDLAAAGRTPTAGLDAASRAIMGETLERSTLLIAAVFDRAIRDAAVMPPRIRLGWAGFAAWLDGPFAGLSRWRRGRALKRMVRVMAKEYAATGHVSTHLREEERAKRDAYDNGTAERPHGAAGTADAGNVVAFEPRPNREERTTDEAEVIVIKRQRQTVEPARPAPHGTVAPAARQRTPGAVAHVPHRSVRAAPPPPQAATAELRVASSSGTTALAHAAAASLLPGLNPGLSNFRDRRTASTAPLRRETPAAAAALSALPDYRRTDATGVQRTDLRAVPMPPRTVPTGSHVDEMDELLRALPRLGTKYALLLAGAGFGSIRQLGSAGVDAVCAAVLRFALTPNGQRILSGNEPPDTTAIASWIDAARAARVA